MSQVERLCVSMQSLYEKNKIRHFLVWLAAYLLLSVVAINTGRVFGVSEHVAAAAALLVYSPVMLVYLLRTGISTDIGLWVRPAVPAPRMWFYLPLVVLVGLPLVGGVRADLSAGAVIAILIQYVCVGFSEEALFRGLLLRALLDKWRPVWAVLLAAVTFGLGHAVSILVGQSGGNTALQIINATVVGLIFTLVVLVTGSLRAVIVAHVLYNTIAAVTGTIEGVGIIVTGIAVLLLYGAWLLAGAGGLAQLRERRVPASAPGSDTSSVNVS